MALAVGRFHPRLVPTLITVPIALLCLALGVWQVQRLHWKEALIARREAALQAAPVAAPQSLAAARDLDLHRVVDAGVFLNDKEILVHAIAPEGGAGFDVLTPLREADGRIVFVNRGFVSAALKDRRRRTAGEPAGDVRVAGLLRLPARPGWFVPSNRALDNEWFSIDPAAMAAADRLADVAPFTIDADATPNPGGWPQGGVTLPPLPNHHLQYAVTWFSLAAAAVVIYVLSQWQEGGGDERL